MKRSFPPEPKFFLERLLLMVFLLIYLPLIAQESNPPPIPMGDCDFAFTGTPIIGQSISDGTKLATLIDLEVYQGLHIRKIKFTVLSPSDALPPIKLTFASSEDFSDLEETPSTPEYLFLASDMSITHLGSNNDGHLEKYEVEINLENEPIEVFNFAENGSLFWFVFVALEDSDSNNELLWLCYNQNNPNAKTMEYYPSIDHWFETDVQMSLEITADCVWIDPQDPDGELLVEVTDSQGNAISCVENEYYVKATISTNLYNSTFLLKDDTDIIYAEAENEVGYLFGPYNEESSHSFSASNNGSENFVVTNAINYPGDYELCDIGLLGYVMNDLQIYPSPFEDELHFDSNQSIDEACLFDLSGKLITKQKNLKGKTSFDTSKLAPGYYILKVHQNYLEKTFRILKR